MPAPRDPYDVSTREGFLRRAITLTDQRIPPRFRTATASHPDVLRWRVRFTAGPQSLLILGPTGSGKTHQAYGAIRDLASAGVTVGWQAVTAPDLLAALRPRDGADSETLLARYAGAGLLFLDDLGAAKATEWTEEILYRIINHRYEAALPTIITSNVPPAQLRDAHGDRVASRLSGMAVQVALRGPDRRRPA